MKKIIVFFTAGFFLITSVMFTGCMDDTLPTNFVTADQVQQSAKATEALLWAIPAFTNNFNSQGNESHWDWGLGSIFKILDVMTEDYTVISSGFDWYSTWASNTNQGEGWAATQFHWNFFWRYIQTSNNLISALSGADHDAMTPIQQSYLGMAYAFRAYQYLFAAQMYEFLENDVTNRINTAGNDVWQLTIPIVNENTTEEQARNNPRVPRKAMFDFIMDDLDNAVKLMSGTVERPNPTRPSKVMPSVAVAYGLIARANMWVGNYPQAAEFARKAINEGGHRPLTRAEWHNTTTGFNTLATPSWMWGSQMMPEDRVVISGILNWTSWMSNEARYGYCAAGPTQRINVSTYDRISNDDWRKLTWKAPAGHPLAGQSMWIDPAWGATRQDHAATKFRPNEGNVTTFSVGSSSAYPKMRIEEMYFIEAEAVAHTNDAAGKELLESFMRQYRYDTYECIPTDKDGIIDEIFFQKRVEFWGEGIVFFDWKRLNKPVTRGYVGTNFPDARRFNTTTRPGWMNLSIVRTEKNTNEALEGFENPDPSGEYIPWVE
jgi:hypothetical protein